MEAAPAVEDWQAVRDLWLDRLGELARSVRLWAEQAGWAARPLDKKLHDSRLGSYPAPALLLQKEFTRLMLEPVGRFAPEVDGVAHLYLMPQYDLSATLTLCGATWFLRYAPPETPADVEWDSEPEPLTREVLDRVLADLHGRGA